MKIMSYNKYQFLLDNFDLQPINESSEFAQQQMNNVSSPLGPGYGFATDPQLSIYSDANNPYIDNYARLSQIVADLGRVMKGLQGVTSNTLNGKIDYFLEDLEEYQNLKILRIFINTNLKLDVFISFDFMEEEFFGVYRNFNGINEPKLDTDLLSDPRFSYMDREYYIKLKNYLFKILSNWFVPVPGDYRVLADELKMRNSMGQIVSVKKGVTITVKGYNNDADNNPFIMVKYKNDVYEITKNDYYYFKYRTDKIK